MAFKWNLQLFAEGTGEGAAGAPADAGQDTGVNAADAADQRLAELGVPADKLAKHKARRAQKYAEQTAQPQTVEEAPAPAEDAPKEPEKASWDEIMKDPDYNAEMQKTVQARVKAYKDREAKLAPAMEILAKRYGLETENLDADKLAEAIVNDQSFYEDRALELGVSVDEAMKLDQAERKAQQEKQAQDQSLRDQLIQQHFEGLQRQAEELKKVFPSFDLMTEIQNNETFARMTAPGGGISVEDAYYATHRKELQAAQSQVIAQKTAQMVTNNIRSGMARPVEAGTGAASVPSFNTNAMSREQREALKKRIRQAAARGERIYPGQ